ncbi:MAG: fasciclin domain-containing protein [Acidimicrobiales bacterium]
MALRPALGAAALALLAACSSDAIDADTSGTGVSVTVDSETVDSLASDASRTADSVAQTAESVADAAQDLDASDAQAATDDLAAALRDNGLTNLATLIEQVDVTQIVGDGEFTLFAPDDGAFLGVAPDTAADLATDPSQVEAVLRNHVVKERIEASDLAERSSVTADSGNALAVAGSGDTLTVGGANVVTADIEAGDGVVHVIDKVLIP